MLGASPKHVLVHKGCRDCLHPSGCILTHSIQSTRSIVLTPCRYYNKHPNFSSRNYYEILGVERTSSLKDIKKAFYKLSKEYHPDSNSSDKSLHDKFVKINEAFSILSKQSTRSNYDQSLSSVSRSPYQSYARQSTTDWSNVNSNSRYTYQQRAGANQSAWGTPNYDQAYYDALRRRMQQDRQRAQAYGQYYSIYNRGPTGFFTSLSVILIVMSLGLFLHALQYRTLRFADPSYAFDRRSRHYHAYREWRRMHTVKDEEFVENRNESSTSSAEKS